MAEGGKIQLLVLTLQDKRNEKLPPSSQGTLRCTWPFTLSLEVICTVTTGNRSFQYMGHHPFPPETAVFSVPRRHHLGISQKLTSWILSRYSRLMPWKFTAINLYLGVTECIFLTAHDLLLKQLQNTLFLRGYPTCANSQNFLG